ncbi:MAG TPA: hypothetical protein PKD61_06990, partial [Polyangiaceae bacterium]|nr:hypothetical protein [Polyangiaceae bacterium]
HAGRAAAIVHVAASFVRVSRITANRPDKSFAPQLPALRQAASSLVRARVRAGRGKRFVELCGVRSE